MGHPRSTRALGRTVVVGLYVTLLVLVGEPGWLAALLGLTLAGVWAAPLMLATNRRRSGPVRGAPALLAVEPGEAGPTS